MPKLAHDIAQEAEEQAQKGGPEPLPEGIFVLRLLDVEVSDNPGDSGYHYWKWHFRVEDEGYKGRELWRNTSLSPKALGILGNTFEGFGVPADTDTDELCGKLTMAMVKQKIIEFGKRKGDLGNEISYFMPYDEDSAETPLDQATPTSSRTVEDF